ncbi:probable E3 ubiquitin-protein ligase RNF144A-A [Stegostoma tigrinum]|uniref:probable E3 ubiquitin-protein ligase RNF144A-A n=1 Tax=Stegostoma tigrinum TaxID=3053191 RepID=UPI00202B5A62|nr:probable E3 ubiquitin-protein ligase RNF144A-A [Stegostoma tigrinum]
MEIIVYDAMDRRFLFGTVASLETGDHETSCGHVVKSSGLKQWCKALLDEGGFTFNCPKCAQEWPWQEVRKIAQLTQEECRSYEAQLHSIMKPKAKSYKKCPSCSLYVQRMDPEMLSVQCLPCSEKSDKSFQFCWECLREWKNADGQSDSCGNKSCSLTALLLSCGTIKQKRSEVYGCPKVRACPKCETLTQHCLSGCPDVLCPNCHHQFCYRCLGFEECNTNCCIAKRQKLTGIKDNKIKSFMG